MIASLVNKGWMLAVAVAVGTLGHAGAGSAERPVLLGGLPGAESSNGGTRQAMQGGSARRSGSANYFRPVERIRLSAPEDVIAIEPLEDRLSAGSIGLFKSARHRIRRIARTVRWSATRWAGWTVRALAFIAIALVAPLVDRGLLATWRSGGWRGTRTAVALGMAVYARLLFDRRAPLAGKALVAVAVAYGVASRDLMPDGTLPLGILDDVIAVALASRCFTLLCPGWLVEEHAIEVARTRDRLRAWQRSQILPPAG